MTGYGFKLFALEVMKRDGRTPLGWVLDDDDPLKRTPYLDMIETILKSKISETERGLPLGPDTKPLTPAEQKARPVFQIEKVQRRGSHNLLIELRYGRHKDEDKGLPATEAVTGAIDLTEYAPTRKYRLGIFAPTTGTVGMMAVEAIAGACPSRYFVKWLRRWMLDATIDAAGNVGAEWYKLSAKPTMDPDLLRKYVKQARADSVVLVQRATGQSRLRRDERFRLEATVFSNQSDRVMTLVQQAITSGTSEEHSDAGYAADLAEILGADLSNLELDDAWVVIETESGKQSISPSRVPEIFVYPIDNVRPNNKVFRKEAKDETLRLRQSLESNVELQDW